MSVGERGGTTRSLDEARELQEEFKAMWSHTIRQAILHALSVRGRYHADDLIPLGIPADCKNIVGAQTNALVRKGLMVETGERRATSDPAGHGRRSAVYRSTASREGGSDKSRAVASLSAHADPGSERERGAPPELTQVAPAGESSVAHPGDREQVTACPEPPLPSPGSGQLLLLDVPVNRFQDAA